MLKHTRFSLDGLRRLPRGRVAMLACLLVVLPFVPLSGCYYVQAIHGHMEVMNSRRPVSEILADPAAPANLKERLELVREARRFAVDELALPDNDSYRSYADLERDYVVWNVFAAPEFSLAPKHWCFPVAGCVAYRGYFSQEAAGKKADALERDGYDVAVGGVAAYSTLGRFADPVLNTMLRWSDTQLVATLFHELAHQLLYVKGDTQFNESFASAVAEIGINRWLAARGGDTLLEDYRAGRRLQTEIVEIIEAHKVELALLYDRDLPAAEMRRRKSVAFEQLGDDLAKLLETEAPAFAHEFVAPANNAALVSYGLYEGWREAFEAMYLECERSLECFYRRTRELADLSFDERSTRLAMLESG